jgi:hypothetical protein
MWVWILVQDARPVRQHTRGRNRPNNFEWALKMQVEDLEGNVLRIALESKKKEAAGSVARRRRLGWRHRGNQKCERID